MYDGDHLALTHDLTPPFLSLVNDKLAALLKEVEVETAFLLRLVSLRHKLVVRELNRARLKNKKQFVKSEIECNKQLESITYRLREEAKSEVISLKRASHAVKRYK
ncbi:hypothetical protein [Alteromonas sp.]|uniref:hypothetical protein n=1 Tax=Alteromonas sp. TaxID=232 RepID=UPI000C515C9E|nr:hypothetical protein [Alteromonas sp.]MBM88324.1 hypothetical protein [Gammaproteobacteria bacterium]NQY17564.1 hypothetical protein [Alteromonas sp.]